MLPQKKTNKILIVPVAQKVQKKKTVQHGNQLCNIMTFFSWFIAHFHLKKGPTNIPCYTNTTDYSEIFSAQQEDISLLSSRCDQHMGAMHRFSAFSASLRSGHQRSRTEWTFRVFALANLIEIAWRLILAEWPEYVCVWDGIMHACVVSWVKKFLTHR